MNCRRRRPCRASSSWIGAGDRRRRTSASPSRGTGRRRRASFALLPGAVDLGCRAPAGTCTVALHRRQVVRRLTSTCAASASREEVEVRRRDVGVLRLRADRPRQALAAERDRAPPGARPAAGRSRRPRRAPSAGRRSASCRRSGRRPLALAELLPRRVVADAVEVLREVALARPLLDLRRRRAWCSGVVEARARPRRRHEVARPPASSTIWSTALERRGCPATCRGCRTGSASRPPALRLRERRLELARTSSAGRPSSAAWPCCSRRRRPRPSCERP